MSEINFTINYRDIKDFLGYRVGDDGSIWSRWKRISLGKGKGSRTILTKGDWVKLKVQVNEHAGKCCINLKRGGKIYNLAIHRLVLEAFVGPCPNGMEGCHFPDKDITNNKLSNLRWDTKSANKADRIIHGTDHRGEKSPVAKLAESDVLEIIKLYKSGEYYQHQLANKFGVSQATISLITLKKNWKHIT